MPERQSSSEATQRPTSTEPEEPPAGAGAPEEGSANPEGRTVAVDQEVGPVRPTPTPRAPAAEPDVGEVAARAAGNGGSGAGGPSPRPSPAAPADSQVTQVISGGVDRVMPVPFEQPTDQLPRGVAVPDDRPTEWIRLSGGDGAPGGTGGDGPPVSPDDPGSEDGDPPRGHRRLLLGVAVVVALLAALYVADLLLSAGTVPRGTVVAGVQVGGLSRADAEQRLRDAVEPRSTRPVTVRAAEVQTAIDPRAAGLRVDWKATLDQAGSQPWNPITRLLSFFTDRTVEVVNTSDERSVSTTLAQLAPLVDRPPTEGTVRFDGLDPVPVNPVNGRRLDVPGSIRTLEREWASGAPVALPLVELPAATSPEDVRNAIDDVARPAVSAPVTILGEGTQATITPQSIASALSFRADPSADPNLVPEVNVGALTDAVEPQLAATEKPGRDASLDFSSGRPVVIPSQDGRGIDYEATFSNVLDVLTTTIGPRQITAVYADQPAKLTTEELQAAGITGEISSFTTGGFASDSGMNIRRAAEQLNGIIVAPGETFSLNDATNPRDAAHGYIEAGIIEDGHPARGVGGGVSQVATTLYNAAYFAGMVDVEHKEHSFYISRYPVAREATVFENLIDVKFRNDGPTAVLIQTLWTPQSITVKVFGTKRYDVTSTTGPRTDPTSPNTVIIPPGQDCHPSRGAPGFTATDTRTLRDIATGQTRSETRTVKYNPSPIIVCSQ